MTSKPPSYWQQRLSQLKGAVREDEGEEWAPSELAYSILSPRQRGDGFTRVVLSAVVEGETMDIGFALLSAHPGGISCLEQIALDDRVRGQGLGSGLLSEVIAAARSAGATQIQGVVTVRYSGTPTPELAQVRAQWFSRRGFQVEQAENGDWDLRIDLAPASAS